MLEGLRGLIVSIQPEADSLLNRPEIVALLAQAAVANGASGVRIEECRAHRGGPARGRRCRSWASSSARIRGSRRTLRPPRMRLRQSWTPARRDRGLRRDRAPPARRRRRRRAGGANPRPRRAGDGRAAPGRGGGFEAAAASDAEIVATTLCAAIRKRPAGTRCRPSTCCAKRSPPARSRSSKAALPAPTRSARPSAPVRGAVMVGPTLTSPRCAYPYVRRSGRTTEVGARKALAP